MSFIEIELVNWSKHQRKDVKKPSWFALDNRVLEDAKLFDLTDGEWKALLYIFCQASQQHASTTVRLTFAHAKRVCEIQEKTLRSAIDKLENAGVTRTSRERHAHVTPQDRTGQDKQDKTRERVDATSSLPPLAEIWNEHCGKLSRVKKTNPARNRKAMSRWAENSPEEWIAIVQRIARTEFCIGKNNRGWKADFDWLLQPETHLKVSEGKYDGGEASGFDWEYVFGEAAK